MADVIGPNSYLPGQSLTVPVGMMCDEHQDRVATNRIVGETDSFGSELIDMCQECYSAFKAFQSSPENYLNESTCEICNSSNIRVTPTRDPEEGLCGRVYDACDGCRANLLNG